MKSCILPFSIDVEMRAYQNKAFPLGVIKANVPNYNSWLCNRLINCIYRSNGRFDAYHEGLWSVDEGLMIMQSLQLKTEVYRKRGIDIISFNKEMIQEGAYITGYCNEFYINGKDAYLKYDRNRDYIIFGFDDEKKVFKSAGYLQNGQYSYYDIEYNEYYKSLIERNAERTHIEYYQVNKAYCPTVDIVSVEEKLNNYLYSRRDSCRLDPEAYCYGVEVWKELVECVQNIEEEDLNCKAGRFYMEHRYVMARRIKTLYEQGFLKDVSISEDYYDKVALPAQNIHYLFIKYNLTRDASVRSRIIYQMKNINMIEKEIINKVLENMVVI